MSGRRNSLSRAAWAARLAGKLRKRAGLVFEVGDELVQAKAELAHGEWLPLLGDVGISSRYAQRFMRIARSEWLRKYAPGAYLPDDLKTLEELAGLDEATLDRWAANGLIHAGMRPGDVAAARQQDIVTAARAAGPLPDGPFGVMAGDPAWRFETWSPAGRGRSADGHYPVPPLDKIVALGPDIEERAAPDCALFLWFLGEMYDAAKQVVEAWGFRYVKLGFIWIKPPPAGTGYSTRDRAEACMLAVRGRPRVLDHGVDQVIEAPRREHSRKPDEFYERIERLYPGPFLNLFARSERPGWAAWGNEVGKFGREAPAIDLDQSGPTTRGLGACGKPGGAPEGAQG